LEYGMLTGKFPPDVRFADDDHRNRRWGNEEFARRRGQVEALRQTCAGRPFTLAQLAIGFSLSYPEASVVICGAKRPVQVDENMAAGALLGPVITAADLRLARELLSS